MTEQKQTSDMLNIRRRLDPDAGANFGARDGMVRLQLWSDNRDQEDYSIWMTPGQAMQIIEGLSRAARLALKGSLS